MNDAAKKWVKALRSGEYKQGKELLREGDKFCCLGVACELAVKEGIINNPKIIQKPFVSHVSPLYEYEKKTTHLPEKVMKWLGLRDNEGGFFTGRKKRKYLTTLNDNGRSFKQIARYIELEPKDLFE